MRSANNLAVRPTVRPAFRPTVIRRISLFVVITALFSIIAVITTTPAEARRVRSSSPDFGIVISPDSIRVDAGGVASFPITVQSSRGTVRPVFDVDNLPRFIDAEIERLSSSRYRLDLFVPANAASSNAVYRLRATSGRRVRTALFRLEVVGRVAVLPSVLPNVPPTLAPTVPPVTVPPTVPPQPTIIPVPITQPTIAPNFNLSVAKTEYSANTEEQIGIPIVVDRPTGFTGPVQFTLLNPPTGLVAGYLPNPSNAGTTLYLTPKPDTPAGRHVMTVVGTAGNVQRAFLIALTVQTTGDFALLPSPASATRTTPGAVNYRIDLGSPTNIRPFVNLSVAGVPAGATATFNTNDTNKSPVTMTVTTTAATPNGTYNLTVTGKSGNFVKQAVVQLIVSQSTAGFSISADTNAVTVPRGQSKVLQLTIRPTGGFVGTINTTFTGLPGGVSAVVGTANGSVNQPIVVPITITVGQTALPTAASSSVPITITSSSGVISAQVVVNLTIT